MTRERPRAEPPSRSGRRRLTRPASPSPHAAAWFACSLGTASVGVAALAGTVTAGGRLGLFLLLAGLSFAVLGILTERAARAGGRDGS